MKKRIIFAGCICICIAAGILISLKFFSAPEGSSARVNEPAASITLQPTIPQDGRWPIPTFSPVLRISDKSGTSAGTDTVPEKRYLIENPIQIKENTISKNSDGIKIELRYPQIEGLADASVQNRINNDLKNYAERTVKDSELYRKDLKEVRLHYYVYANYNNVLCLNTYQSIVLVDDSYFIKETLLYELVAGERLELKDVFKNSSGFPKFLNLAIEEHIIKANLEEQILKSPFKGIREGQDFELTESRLTILLEKNDEFTFNGMFYGPNNITFRLPQFQGLVDIYDKFADPGKKIYLSNDKKKKMVPNDMEERFINVGGLKGNFFTEVQGRMFTGMKNIEFQKKLNEICSYTGENEFRKLIPLNLKKTDDLNKMPSIRRDYHLTGNYCDVICIESSEYYNIPGGKANNSRWHTTYNIITGKKLGIQELFKRNFDWKTALAAYIKEDSQKRNLRFEGMNLDQTIAKADFWFDEEKLWLNLKPEVFVDDQQKNENVFFIPFKYLGDENFTMRQ